jgi:hypothetical protein
VSMMSNEKNGLLITVLKKAIGVPTGNSSCCSAAVTAAPKEAPEQKTGKSGTCCSAR